MHTALVRLGSRTHSSARGLAAGACGALLLACAGSDIAAPAPGAQMQELRVTTLADASCTLHARGDDAHGLHLGSSHSGRVNFDARRVAAATEPAVLELECSDAKGARDVQRLDLDSMLANGVGEEPRAAAPRVRPALSGDLEHISQRELVAGGYPRRPDAPPDSDVYRNWVDSVSMPMRVVEWDGARSELKFEDHKSSDIWCGAVATSAPYDWAFGEFVEPHIGSSSTQAEQIGAIWVGVGGATADASDTLIQAGTRQDYASFFGMEASTHQVFRQVYPQTDAHYCSNCNLNEGDSVEFSAQIQNLDGSGNGTGTLYYWNVTQGEMAAVDIPFSGGFTGSSAEWVVEDPRQLGNGLPEFGTVVFNSMQTYSGDTGYVNFGSSNYDTYDISINSHTYCSAHVESDSSISITRQPD